MRRAPTRCVALLTMLALSGLLSVAAPLQHSLMPPGTKITIQTADVIDSDGTNLNAEYHASLADPLMVGSVVVAPKGAPAMLRVVQLDQAGAVKGRVSLGIQLVAVTIDGRRRDVHTGQATIQSDSQGAKTAKRGLLGGILGATVGAIAGGSGGAAKGAAIGAAAGAGAAAISGVKVTVPKETRLSFTVVHPPLTVEGCVVRAGDCTRQKTASVTCELTVINQRADRTLTLVSGAIVDPAGVEQQATKMQLGRSKFSANIAQSDAVYHSPIPVKLQCGGITPDVTTLSSVRATFSVTGPGGDVRFDAVLRNIPIPR